MILGRGGDKHVLCLLCLAENLLQSILNLCSSDRINLFGVKRGGRDSSTQFMPMYHLGAVGHRVLRDLYGQSCLFVFSVYLPCLTSVCNNYSAHEQKQFPLELFLAILYSPSPVLLFLIFSLKWLLLAMAFGVHCQSVD